MVLLSCSYSDRLIRIGMEKLCLSSNAYMKNLTRRTEGEGKEKLTPIAYLGATMTRHGEDFAEDSIFGQCLVGGLALVHCIPVSD